MSQPACTKRKCSQGSDSDTQASIGNGRPTKQARRSTPCNLAPLEDEALPLDTSHKAGIAPSEEELLKHIQEPPPLLSESESQILDSVYKNVMDKPTPDITLKRTPSRRSVSQSDASASDRTPRSSNSNVVYRCQNLAAAKIYLHVEPPDDIELAVTKITDAELDSQRRAELKGIAEDFHLECVKNVTAQAGEDDCLAPLDTAIRMLRLQNLCLREKATWQSELKPVIPKESRFSWSIVAKSRRQFEVDDNGASLPAAKRQHQRAINEYISPESSIAKKVPVPTNESQENLGIKATTPVNDSREDLSMGPPPRVPVPAKEDHSPLKTPVPDMSLGIHLQALISALSLQSQVNKHRARDFLAWIQKELVQHEPGGPFEPMLTMVPAVRAMDLTFPFAVIEGKAYSTGKQIYEAENQAAVSIACAHNILRQLDYLVASDPSEPLAEEEEAEQQGEGEIQEPQRPRRQPPSPARVLFSITTQGPLHELWVHWTTVEDGVRVFASKLCDSWNGLVPAQASDFIVKLYNVCAWGTGPFMKSLVENLGTIMTQARVT